MLVFSIPLVYCCPFTFSLTSHNSQSKRTVYTDSVWLWGWGGGVELRCRPYSAGVWHSVSNQIQNLQNCYTTPKKNDQKRRHLGIGVFKVPSFMAWTLYNIALLIHTDTYTVWIYAVDWAVTTMKNTLVEKLTYCKNKSGKEQYW